MAFKTTNGYRNQRRPETAEAVKRFEEKSGLKVLSARCRPKGSMRPYVNFLVQYETNLHSFELKKIKDAVIAFAHPSHSEKDQWFLDVTWTSLEMAQPF